MGRLEPVSIAIAAPAVEVWEVIGPQFDRIGVWASSIPTSTADPDAAPTCGAPVGGRICTSTVPGFPHITETILDYDPKRMELTYVATTGMPWFVASARNTWQVHPHDSSTATVTIAAAVEPKPTRGSGALVAAMSPAFTRLGRITLDDLKHFIETGEPSPRKRKRRRR